MVSSKCNVPIELCGNFAGFIDDVYFTQVSSFLAACDLRALGLFRNIIFFNFGEYLQCDVVTLSERA